MPPQTGDREREPWGAATMEVAEANWVYAALHLPLCAHTAHVKPSDACTAALTCQSKLGEGPRVSLTKSNRPLAAHVGEGNNKDVKGGVGGKRRVLICEGFLAGCENVLKALCVSPDVEGRVSEVGVFEAVGRTELRMCQWVGQRGRKGKGCER